MQRASVAYRDLQREYSRIEGEYLKACEARWARMEAALAAEILRGDGRKAAARRCGISDATAKTHLRNIFEKTGTHRQAELILLLLGASDARDMEI